MQQCLANCFSPVTLHYRADTAMKLFNLLALNPHLHKFLQSKHFTTFIITSKCQRWHGNPTVHLFPKPPTHGTNADAEFVHLYQDLRNPIAPQNYRNFSQFFTPSQLTKILPKRWGNSNWLLATHIDQRGISPHTWIAEYVRNSSSSQLIATAQMHQNI